MTDAEIRELVQRTADETAKRVVKETFLTLGVSIEEPLEVQADMQHLRSWRKSTAAVQRQGLMVIIAVLLTGTLGLIWTTISAKTGQ